MRCKNCGSENSQNEKYCNRCRKKLEFSNYNKPKDNKKLIIIPAVIIALLTVVILVVVVLRNQNLYVTINNSDTSNMMQQSSNSNESNVENNSSVSHSDETPQDKTYQNNVKLRRINVIDQYCTSILTDSFKKDYGPHKVLDGDKSTVWAEGVDGSGYGESITLCFNSVYTVKKLKIVNGLVNAYDGYYKNNRVASIKIGFSDGSSQIANLRDDETGYQVINLSQGVDTSYITITIDSVYSGYKYDDTCISEVVVLGY